MNNHSIPRKADFRVAVIGGGPAGCFFALYLLRYAQERNIRPEITIYQERDFDRLGPRGCKGCAGILSMSLLRNLSELGLTIPPEIIQSKVEQYAVHSPYTSLSLTNPEKTADIVSIYRGGGPRLSHEEHPLSFDGWLLRETESRGVTVKNQRVFRIDLEQGARIEVAGKELEYDLVVLAAGVNSKPPVILGLEYTPPPTRVMAQDELYVGTAQVRSRLGNVAHAFLMPHSGLIFGTLVPKGPFINVSVLSSGAPPISVAEFLNYDIVRRVLPDHYERACGCHPHAVIGPADNYYADKFVAIGDAAITRLYKDGIGSALLTARGAARTVVNHGLSRQDFEHHYHPFCQRMNQDNRWGQILFSINDKTKNSPAFLLAQQRLVGDEQRRSASPQPFTKAAWGMFTGNYSYRAIAWMSFSPASLIKLSAAFFWESLTGFWRQRESTPRRLLVGGRKILILGSGFGGTYALRHLVPSLNRNENVEITMVSDENFFLFSPLLHEVATGRIIARHIAYPIRRLHWRDRFNFVQTELTKIDLSGRKVITSRGTFDFDYLILALGSVTNMAELDSARENIFTLKTLTDAMLMRNRVIEVFEQASTEREPERQKQLLTFIVSGAGYTGVQLVTELRDFIYGSLTRFYKTINPDNIRIMLVEAEPKIIAELHTKLGAYTMRQLKEVGIEVRLKSRVTRVWEDKVEINNSEILPSGTLIWVAGVVANPRIAELDATKDDIGRVVVNEYLELPEVPGVYAVGDCAHFVDPKSGKPVPPRAHIAARQAKVAAHNILADIRGRDKKPYRYADPPEMITLGAAKAVFRFHNLRLYGLPARLIWLVGYSLLITGNYNRIRIITDWFLSLIFGRDTTFLKLK